VNAPRALLVFHLADVGGPPRSLRGVAQRLADAGGLEVLVPGHGAVEEMYRPFGAVTVGSYAALTGPRSVRDALALPRRLAREVLLFRRVLRRVRPDVVVVVTTVLPSALVAARRARVASVL
jgi:ADP-heptose:LPS heptosyltransferase